MITIEENSQNINDEHNVDSADIIENKFGNGETEIVFANKNEVQVNFNQEIEKVLSVIEKIQDEEKKITDKEKIKNDMHSLIETVNNFLKSGDNESEFVYEQRHRRKSSEIISLTLTQLNNMSKKLIDNANDCYSKDLLDKLRNVLYCFGRVTKYDISLHTQCTDEIFAIMQNIREHSKKLLFTAIENFQPDKQDEQCENSSLHSVLANIMETNIKILSICNLESIDFFSTDFCKEIFGKLIPVLNKNNANDNLKQYNINLIDTIFGGILRFYAYSDDNSVYYIGKWFIEEYYLKNDIKNSVDWKVPNLGKFISEYSRYGTYSAYIDYFPIKIELMSEKIKVLKEDRVKDVDKYFEHKCRWSFCKYFNFDSKEFFDHDNNSDEAKKLRSNMGYMISCKKDLEDAWGCCNKLFHEYKKIHEEDLDSGEKRDQYEKMKKNRADIYNLFRELETEKQKLLKKRLVNIIRNKFRPLSLFEKIFRLSLLVIAFPIYAPVFISVKTLRRFLHWFFLGLECIWKLCFFLNEDDCKDIWARDCESGNLDGLKINDEEIVSRIQWYETKNWLFWRRILFPIDLLVHIIIGIFFSIKKLFTSIIKVFITAYRVGNDVICNDACSYIFKDFCDSEVICNMKSKISVLPTSVKKVQNKFVDTTCPRCSRYNLSEKPKSVRKHFLCLIGLESVKDIKYYDEYLHEPSNTPRMKYKQEKT